MFYNKKWMYFAVLFLMSSLIYVTLRDQSMFSGIMYNIFFGAVILYAALVAACFLATIAIMLVFKGAYIAGCEVCSLERKADLSKIFWIVFTALGYGVLFIAYLKLIWY